MQLQKKPMLSVIVPAYNIEEWLGECVESILAQTYRDFEVIIVDDGSTDATASVASRYASEDKRITLISKANEGPGEARNAGLREARGEYVTFIDGDDLVHPEMLMALMRCAEKTDAPIVSCGMAKFTAENGRTADSPSLQRAQGSATRQLHLCKDISRLYYRQSPLKAVEKMLYQTGWTDNSAWGKVYKRQLFEALRFPAGLYEDLDLIPRVYVAAAELWPSKKTVHIPLDFYYYRQREGSIIHTWSADRLDVLKVTEHLCATLPASLRKAADDRRLSACFNMFLLIQKQLSGKLPSDGVQKLPSNGAKLPLDGDKKLPSAGAKLPSDREKLPSDGDKKLPSGDGAPELLKAPELLSGVTELCWSEIKRLRMQSLFNPRVRFKNKAGIIASLLGPHFLKLLN